MFLSRFSISFLLLLLRSTDASYKLHFDPQSDSSANLDRALGAAIQSRFDIEFKKASEEALLKSSIEKSSGLSRGGRQFYSSHEPLCKFEQAYMDWNRFIEEKLCPMLNMEESRKFCDKRSNCFVKFDCYGNGSSIGAVPVKNCVRNEFVHPSNTCDKSRLDSAQFCHNTDPMLHSFAFTNHCPVPHVPKGYEQARKQECCERKRHQTPEKTVRCYVADFSSIEEYELYIRIHTKGVLTPDRNRKYRHMIKYRLPEKCCAYL